MRHDRVSLGDAMKLIIDDLSPFRNFYYYSLVVLIIVVGFLSLFFHNYPGLLPFTKSMNIASDIIKIANDAIICYAIVIFTYVFISYFIKGVSPKTKMILKNHERWFLENGAKELTINRRLIMLVNSIVFSMSPFLWIEHFGFSSAGDTPLMNSTLAHPDFIILLFMILGFLSSLFLLIFAITSWEFRKNVM